MTTLPTDVPAATPERRPLTMLRSGYWFAAFLVVTLFAFWPSYFSKLPARVDLYTHLHSALMIAWFGLLIAQPFLVRRGRLRWHRLLGRASYPLVALIAITWVQLVHVRIARMPDDLFAREGKFAYLPFVSAVLFLSAYGMAILRRRTTPLHARYMVCTAFALVDAVTSRLLFFNFPELANPLMYQVIGFGLTEVLIGFLWLIDSGPHRRAFAQMFVLLYLFTVQGNGCGARGPEGFG